MKKKFLFVLFLIIVLSSCASRASYCWWGNQSFDEECLNQS